MILSKEVEINLNSANIKHYEDIGYAIPRELNKNKKLKVITNSKILVKVSDLTKGSNVTINLQCDYCDTPYESKYYNYCKSNINGIIHKDACFSCGHIKEKESNMLIYGVENALQRPEVRKKFNETCIERYGSENFGGTDEWKEKVKKTNLDRYGSEYAQSNNEIKEKIRNAQNFDIEFIRKEFGKRDYKLLSYFYINNTQDLDFICNKHSEYGVQTTTYANLNSSNHVCKICENERKSELYSHDYNFVKSIFEDNKLILISKKYTNENQELEFTCNRHLEYGVQTTPFGLLLHRGNGCRYCGIERRSGINHFNWKGGISPLQNYLRDKINDWKINSIKQCNYKCILTGDRFDAIHHLYSFSNILEETLDILSIGLKNVISEYTLEELSIIESKLKELHYKYGLGVCLRKDVHDLFHSKELYGKGNNTPEQFEEFTKRYNNGELHLYLHQNNYRKLQIL